MRAKHPSRTPNQALLERSKRVVRTLKRAYPGAVTALVHASPFELLVATILSAQCTDERVNMVTPGLFRKYPAPAALARARQEELEREIHSTGFFRAKAKNIIGCCRALEERHGGKVPQTMEELTALPGVGRKTANVVLGNAFGISAGVVVDTHVARLANRLGLTKASDPVKIEEDLVAIVPRKDWIVFPHLMISHGRAVCKARTPECARCVIADVCPSSTV
jgi:endonuclease-3